MVWAEMGNRWNPERCKSTKIIGGKSSEE
jgi:hypothetical protein